MVYVIGIISVMSRVITPQEMLLLNWPVKAPSVFPSSPSRGKGDLSLPIFITLTY
ncbi:hypothetical protein MTBMA_c00870 [Methanothermobacter marburgensis str. Marburg]|uniref:Uncharacterized protein n=1 Tax=Methanothermobacter marburgensis (strain ATCC BAA-927 / DSM 2133 / JCM 14651 / NBRC 100331 / OCM 82 / Marburg) TaxID=79929 RepID=D9PTZ9_METTM|nr:hypothetical protein MTBMA_c00870 [Methanothermobacter marburgensis str. Marburg]